MKTRAEKKGGGRVKNSLRQNLIEELQKNGYKLTNQRLAVIEMFSQFDNRHLTCEEIYDAIRAKYSDISLATVYRVIKLLCELDLLHKLELGDGISRYEVNMDAGKHAHHHMICTVCGKITEPKEDLLEELEKKIASEYGFSVTGHTLKLYGICKDCREKD